MKKPSRNEMASRMGRLKLRKDRELERRFAV